jgi:hypothetical protein
MHINDLNLKSYLDELYRQTAGNTEAQVSMYDLGAAIGLDKAEAGSVAEQLMVLGQVELRTLAGGISITPEGLAFLGIAVPPATPAEYGFSLGKGPVADENDRRTIHLLTQKIKDALSGHGVEYELLEEIILDLKTIDVQMLSPKPKIAVLREIMRSLHKAFAAADVDAGKVANLLKTVID